MIAELSRLARHAHPERIPRALEGKPGIFAVDATWGVIQPISLAPGVRTVGELEVIEHLRAGRPILDCRLPEYVERGTIPGAVNIPPLGPPSPISRAEQSAPAASSPPQPA